MNDVLYNHPSFIEEFLGLEFQLTDDGVICRMTVEPKHYSRVPRMHGGLVFTAIDTAMGFTTRRVVGMEKMIATIDISIRYIRTISEGVLTIEVSVVHPGRRVVQLSAEAKDDQGRLVAAATGAFMVVE